MSWENKEFISAMAVWAMRDLSRRRGQVALLFIALATLVCVVATPLLLTRSIANSSEMLLEQGPSLVIRKVTAGGWSTIALDGSIQKLASIPGVLGVRERVWGVSAVNNVPLTLVGVDQDQKENYPLFGTLAVGEGVAGVGTGLVPGQILEIGTKEKRTIFIKSLLPEKSSVVAHDVLLLHLEDCRRILGIPEGSVSDIVVDVYHDGEEQAIIGDLSSAMPWPVQIVTRGDMLAMYNGSLSRRGGIGILLIVPALLALLLLVITVLKQGADSRKEMGILKSMGWSSSDIARFHFWKAILIGIPAVLLGGCLAYVFVFSPAVSLLAVLFLGWQGHAPHFVFSAGESLSLLSMVACLVFFPFLAAVLGPVLLSSTVDPVELIRKD